MLTNIAALTGLPFCGGFANFTDPQLFVDLKTTGSDTIADRLSSDMSVCDDTDASRAFVGAPIRTDC